MNRIVNFLARFGWLIISISLGSFPVFAQTGAIPTHDTAYYESYAQSVIARVYLSEKYTSLTLKKSSGASRLNYRPNSSLNFGAGLTYRRLTLNLAYGFGFLNQDEEKGKTKNLDLQTRIYARKWGIDLFGQFYKGYFLDPKGKAVQDSKIYYTRPDLKVTLLGIAAYRILNYRKFSLRPGFIQDEMQKKSAGSLLAGVELYYADLNDDSAFVPSAFTSIYGLRNIHSARIIQVGPGAGYAYTQVLPYHFFLTGSLTANVNLAFVRESGQLDRTDHAGVNANVIYRIAAGYNNGSWNVTFFRLNSRVAARGDVSGNRYFLNSGLNRLVLGKRLVPGPKGKRLLRPIDSVLKAAR